MDKEARFRAAIEENKDRIYRICCCYVSAEDERKDVYQNVLINIWRSLDRFEGKSGIGTWIYRITVNSCLGHLRTEQRRRKMFENDPGIDARIAPEADRPLEGMETSSDVQRLYACIDKLRPVERALVSLYLEEIDAREMAQILGISETNVRVKLHRIKKALREMWEEEYHGTR